MSKPMDDSNIYSTLKSLTALQYQASGFSFLPKQPVHSVLSGRHSSRLRGRGLNFEELRHYQTGDDIRTMDWKVTNRTKKPHVRVFTEEKERPVMLLVDQRINMFFGSEVKMKSVVAAELAALSAWRVLSVGDRIGSIVFNDNEIVETRPQRSRTAVMRILHNLLQLNRELGISYPYLPEEPQLNKVLKRAQQSCKHDHLVIIVSDMSGWNAETVKRIKQLGQHNDVLAALIFDPLEKHLPETDKLVMSDGNMQLQVDVTKSNLKSRFHSAFESSVDTLQAELNKHGIPVLPIDTVEGVAEQVRQVIGDARRR